MVYKFQMRKVNPKIVVLRLHIVLLIRTFAYSHINFAYLHIKTYFHIRTFTYLHIKKTWPLIISG